MKPSKYCTEDDVLRSLMLKFMERAVPLSCASILPENLSEKT